MIRFPLDFYGITIGTDEIRSPHLNLHSALCTLRFTLSFSDFALRLSFFFRNLIKTRYD